MLGCRKAKQPLVSIASQTSTVLAEILCADRQDDPPTPWLRQEIRNRGLRLQPGAARLSPPGASWAKHCHNGRSKGCDGPDLDRNILPAPRLIESRGIDLDPPTSH
jgi:hypothetical protein